MAQQSAVGEQKVPGLVSGLKVVECGQGVSAAFGAKMLADLGAEVIKVEPPEGDLTRRRGPFPHDEPDPEKSGLFIYLNSNKKGITLDLSLDKGRDALQRLLAKRDVLIHNVPPPERARVGLEGGVLTARFPSLIVTSISPFGDTGPRKDWRAYDLNVMNAGGFAFLSPGASQFPELPPLKPFGHQGDFQGGVHAAFATLAAYWHRMATGAGQAVDISEQECIAAMLEMNFMHYTYAGRETSRLGQRMIAPWTMLDCSDGKAFVVCVEEDQWQRLVELMGNPEWAKEEIFKDRVARGKNADALYALMAEWASTWKVQDLYREGQKRRIAFAPVNTMADLYQSEHLSERGYFVPLGDSASSEKMPGAPSKYSAGGWSLRSPAPRLGQHNDEVLRAELGMTREQVADLTRGSKHG